MKKESFDELCERKVKDLSEALVLIRTFPQDQDAYVHLYYQYLRAYPYLKKNYGQGQFMGSNLGPFHFLEQLVGTQHKLVMEYEDHTIEIKGTRKNIVTHSSYKQELEFRTDYLHPIYCDDSKKFKASFEYLTDSLN